MTVINVRGTSGSGKSTLVRRITECYQSRERYYEPGRKQPIGYVYHRPEGRSLAVIGHYETPCGGCDTIPKMEHIFELVRKSHAAGLDVLFEGLLISADVKRTLALHEEGLPLVVVQLDVDIDTCLDSVNQRRRAKKPDAPDVNPKNTISKHRGVVKSMEKLREAGVKHYTAGRVAAFNLIRTELGL